MIPKSPRWECKSLTNLAKHYECAVGQIERDEALLRQALEALEELQYAVVSTAKTDDVSLYYRAIVALHERLGEGAEP